MADLQQLCSGFLDLGILVGQRRPKVLCQVREGEAVGVDLAQAAGDGGVDAGLGVLVLLQHHRDKALGGRLRGTVGGEGDVLLQKANLRYFSGE